MGYSYRWMRGLGAFARIIVGHSWQRHCLMGCKCATCVRLDYNLFPEALLKRCTPIRRQLLGDGHNIKGWCVVILTITVNIPCK